MLLVNNTFSSAIRYSATDSQDTQTVTLAETDTDTDATSEVNTTLLKALVAKVASSDGADTLEEIRAILNENELDTSAEDFSNSKLSFALATLTSANATVSASAEVADIITSQQQQVTTTALALEDVQSAVATTRIKANYVANQVVATAQKTLLTVSDEEDDSDGSLTTHTSYAELWSVMASGIGNIKSDYVDFYADLMEKYTEMYEAYNDKLQNTAAACVGTGDDANTVKFDTITMRDGFTRFSSYISGVDLGSVKNWSSMTTEEQDSMVATLEPAFTVNSSTGEISFSLDLYNKVVQVPAGIEKGSVSTTSYQAWLATFNAVGSGLQSNMQSFAQRYSQANSTFDNLNKVLSGAISSLADSAKDVLKALN